MKTILIPDVSQVTPRHGLITMHNFLAIDAGGTSTRAVVLDASGQCLGYGTSGGGNPVSRGFEAALACLLEASLAALTDTGKPLAQALIAMAGASLELPLNLFSQGFSTLGLSAEVMIESDLLAAFYSGTCHDDGVALIAGTGAVGARVASSQLAQVADGTGWLLGDNGSGFWLGREVAQAVAAALDGRGRSTALTELMLAQLEIPLDRNDHTQGRLRAQQQLISKVYGQSAIELSRFAPLVFTAKDDPVALAIIDRAADALARTLGAVMPQEATLESAHPIVFGGSVLTKGGAVASAVVERLVPVQQRHTSGRSKKTTPILVEDGVVGAAVLVLKRSGIVVDEAVFARIQNSLAALREGKQSD